MPTRLAEPEHCRRVVHREELRHETFMRTSSKEYLTADASFSQIDVVRQQEKAFRLAAEQQRQREERTNLEKAFKIEKARLAAEWVKKIEEVEEDCRVREAIMREKQEIHRVDVEKEVAFRVSKMRFKKSSMLLQMEDTEKKLADRHEFHQVRPGRVRREVGGGRRQEAGGRCEVRGRGARRRRKAEGGVRRQACGRSSREVVTTESYCSPTLSFQVSRPAPPKPYSVRSPAPSTQATEVMNRAERQRRFEEAEFAKKREVAGRKPLEELVVRQDAEMRTLLQKCHGRRVAIRRERDAAFQVYKQKYRNLEADQVRRACRERAARQHLLPHRAALAPAPHRRPGVSDTLNGLASFGRRMRTRSSTRCPPRSATCSRIRAAATRGRRSGGAHRRPHSARPAPSPRTLRPLTPRA